MARDRDRDIEIDPLFVVPPGIVDVRQQYSADASSVYDEETIAPELILESLDSNLPIPGTFNIVSQTVRISSDGTSVVDVIIEFPDNDTISDIEMRVTKL